MLCKICKSPVKRIFSCEVLNKYIVDYYICDTCGFIQTEEPYWLDEAYKDAINIYDTGIISRNVYFSKIASIILFYFFDKNLIYMDYAGGYGILTRLMRDIGFNFYWNDLYATNLVARGFEYDKGCGKVELITSFESFEHFKEPLQEIEKMLSISKNIIFSTNLIPSPTPGPNDWWYYGPEHGQHISFYSHKTLQFISKKYNLNLYSINNVHLLTAKPLNSFKLRTLCKFNNVSFYFVRRGLSSLTFKDMEGLKAHNSSV
jgi:hypothetical protein